MPTRHCLGQDPNPRKGNNRERAYSDACSEAGAFDASYQCLMKNAVLARELGISDEVIERLEAQANLDSKQSSRQATRCRQMGERYGYNW